VSLNIVPSTSESRKQLATEILLNKTSKISKITDNSVLNGIMYGIAKVSGKAEKDIVLGISKLYPETAFGSQLDQVAQDGGIAPRFGASQSSTYVRVVGDVGTTYTAGVNTFTSVDGIQFNIEETATLGINQFTYIKVRSIDSGLKTNVKPATINKVSPVPTGHRFAVNEYQALGGRDLEDDILFRQRIKEGANILATGTMAMIEQAFMKINSNVLRCVYQGINASGQLKIAILTQNGIALNISELNTLLLRGEKFFSLSELRPFGRQSYGIELVNIDIQPFDISFRCQLNTSANPDDVRIDIQTKISKYIDFRYFVPGVDRIDWVKLLNIARNANGMKYVPDTTFFPSVDISTDQNKIPRLRGFLMLDLNGVVINTIQGTLNPVFYPQVSDFSLQSTVLRTI
jgi:hypothetical protein